jgi:hypothetical protein
MTALLATLTVVWFTTSVVLYFVAESHDAMCDALTEQRDAMRDAYTAQIDELTAMNALLAGALFDEVNAHADTRDACKHCDATDSFNFGQCISCGEQQHTTTAH